MFTMTSNMICDFMETFHFEVADVEIKRIEICFLNKVQLLYLSTT